MKINKFNHDIEQEAAWADRLVSENNWLKHTIEARDTEIEALEAENKRLKAENEALLYSLRKLLHHALDEHYLAHDPDGYVKQADDLVDKIMSER